MKSFSLKWRLTLLLALATLTSLGTAAWIVDWRGDSEMQQRFDSALIARAQAVTELAHYEDGRLEFDLPGDPTAAFPGNASESWYELHCGGVMVARTPQAPPAIRDGKQPHFADVHLADGRTLRVVALRFVPSADDGKVVPRMTRCVLNYALDRDPLDDILDSLDWILLGSLFGVCALVLLLTPLLVRRGLRPLSVLAGAMADIGPDAPRRRLPDSDTRELKPLVARFNDVLARMDAGLAREREFAAGLAHELRTRLTELRALVDIETRYPSGREAHELLGEAGAIGAELESTVTALLQLTRMESGLAQVRREQVSLAALLARAHARHATAAGARNMRIEIASKTGAMLSADPALLDIVLDNLIGNAVSYAPAGSTVLLHSRANGLEVINDAPTLLKEDLDRLGQRFWRKDQGGSGHAGLGLALAAAAARAQHMTLQFELDEAHRLHAMLAGDTISDDA